tara:strand:+ start:247 stop:885 length:639 start_codon:yes stop_codon:yes gene_type:complete
MHKHAALVADAATVLLYAFLLYYDKLVWAATGLHLAVRYGTSTLRSSCVCVSVLQLSNTCERMRAVVPPAAGYGIAAVGLLLCLATHGDVFGELPRTWRGATVITFYTLSLTINRVHSVAPEVDIARVVLFVSLSHCFGRRRSDVSWETEARTCWVLACYAMPALMVALLQLAIDVSSEKPDEVLPTTTQVIETWDVVAPITFTGNRRRLQT